MGPQNRLLPLPRCHIALSQHPQPERSRSETCGDVEEDKEGDEEIRQGRMGPRGERSEVLRALPA